MLGRFEFADYDVLHDLYRKAAPEKYALSPHLLRSHLQQSPLLDLNSSRWLVFDRELVAAAAIKHSASTLYTGPDPLTRHLSFFCFRNFEYAKELFGEVESLLRSQGVQKLVFGQDSRHLFPGCPVDWPEMLEFLVGQGFEILNEQVDLERNLADYTPPVGTFEALNETVVARPCRAGDLVELTKFFDAEFPGRWKYDCLQKWNLDGPDAIMGLFEGEACVGFALLQRDGTPLPIGGAVWGASMGANWGSLGPIGVAQSVRGRGLGDALLAAGLMELKRRGAQRCIIDWTTLVDFYGKHGFAVNRTYKSLVKNLG